MQTKNFIQQKLTEETESNHKNSKTTCLTYISKAGSLYNRSAFLMTQANAIVMMRFDSSEIGQTMSEIVAYGTAVVAEKEL